MIFQESEVIHMGIYDKVSTPSQRLKEALNLRRMKQVELSERSGINKPSISCYVSGKYEPKQMALYQLGRALDVSEMWLAGYDIPMERPQEQKENDEMADLLERIKNEKEFRLLITRINRLNPTQLEAVNRLLDAFPQQEQS
jgi:transcriptional regulator with XRE-family HTH domain